MGLTWAAGTQQTLHQKLQGNIPYVSHVPMCLTSIHSDGPPANWQKANWGAIKLINWFILSQSLYMKVMTSVDYLMHPFLFSIYMGCSQECYRERLVPCPERSSERWWLSLPSKISKVYFPLSFSVGSQICSHAISSLPPILMCSLDEILASLQSNMGVLS